MHGQGVNIFLENAQKRTNKNPMLYTLSLAINLFVTLVLVNDSFLRIDSVQQ